MSGSQTNVPLYSLYYIYRWSSGTYIYERTCGTEDAARRRTLELGHGAVYLTNHLIRGAYY